MNVKPGELAVNIGPRYYGEVYTVLRAYDGPINTGYGPAWWVLHHGKEWHCSDCFLRPIRNPGDDARDDAWDWLPPVPNDISAEDPQDLREALKQWAEEQR